MRLKVLVVDDEVLAREGLKLLLGQQSRVEEITEARNGREAVTRIRNHRPDMVLLDVQMPRMTGFDVVGEIGAEKMPAVIFVTAHDQFAIRAFEVSAVDYLLKPVTQERFDLAFQRAINRIDSAPADESTRLMRTMLDAIANPPRYLTRFAVRSGERTVFVPVDDVDRIEALQNYVRLHTGNITHLLHVSLNTLEASLDPGGFLRIHRSHILNIRRIKQLWSLTHGQYVIELLSGERLNSGRTYGERIRKGLANPF
ncbi:LytTR family DNA-binding domain-containing protein [Povalibacter sp.]|uniref:LytR/AlgR family response regulator transcription factor n=1 Tax=Povalibacter sp. TaxID=1962978 RepID=UPI002F416F25